ncbi:chorismate synthase [Clostridium saccharobutylicum]|uniref:Chorismate synthase n=1 Tax=Clostridium saccharobutylicum DSM 13864 TaxID=1345695 RepID=U5MPS6_CLOSA|nr:chorismate synthase [Clostridium saccharobutylicum]AGX41696.1 chorismate synthase AroC [Clostridium saccharobutylicum DSM 13864]AQR88978.1 chorismate synthase [Clostridium saccharobutylicum]AQR98879.1 chorismate synthase [Clostridium saccharobutylicum]AQS08598.1 chorismate synthase [Clostridium saccharobutylicum]AQS12867.1 chorismate synthase [Clostridium saccharobutylicum]
MSGIWGNKLKVSIFGESHGVGIGITIDGLPSGVEINMEDVMKEMARRAPGKSKLSTARKEGDVPEILSGFFQGKTTGTPLCAVIRNSDMHSKDYGKLKDLMRPGHADYPGFIRYNGFNDYRGGGHFSGRITAPLVFAGAICKQVLEAKGISIGAHVKSVGKIEDKSFNEVNLNKELLEKLKVKELPLLAPEKEDEMRSTILEAKKDQDSVGGTIECTVLGISAGVGNPFFDSVESTLAHLMFSVPAVKGIEFGKGFLMSELRGSQCNDEYYYDGDEIKTYTNNNGGITGGITNGMPILFKVGIKPTPSISKAQRTVDICEKKDAELVIEGRHDPCIVQRAVPVIEAVTAIGILDLVI